MNQKNTTFIQGISSDYHLKDNLFTFHIIFEYEEKLSNEEYQQIVQRVKNFQDMSKNWLTKPYKFSQEFPTEDEEEYSCVVPNTNFDAESKIHYKINLKKHKDRLFVFNIFNMKVNGTKDYRKSNQILKNVHEYCFGLDITQDEMVKYCFLKILKKSRKKKIKGNLTKFCLLKIHTIERGFVV